MSQFVADDLPLLVHRKAAALIDAFVRRGIMSF
jgi:hypothetical protein